MPIALNYDATGYLQLQLPQGPSYDSYKLKLFVHIVDNDNGLNVFELPGHVTVHPNNNLTNDLAKQILANDQQSSVWKIIAAGNLQACSQNIQSFASMTKIGNEPNMSSNVVTRNSSY